LLRSNVLQQGLRAVLKLEQLPFFYYFEGLGVPGKRFGACTLTLRRRSCLRLLALVVFAAFRLSVVSFVVASKPRDGRKQLLTFLAAPCVRRDQPGREGRLRRVAEAIPHRAPALLAAQVGALPCPASVQTAVNCRPSP
jgi:hypothetical protein